jgi:hypothetical protein
MKNRNIYHRNMSSARNLNSPHQIMTKSLCQDKWNTSKIKNLYWLPALLHSNI